MIQNNLTRMMLAAALCLFSQAGAYADDNAVVVTETQSQAASTDGGVVQQKSVVTQQVERRDGLRDEVAAITFQGGVVNVNDADGNSNARAVGGLSAQGNFLGDVNTPPGRPYLGPSISVLYSHLGAPGSNFFGLNSPAGDGGTHMVLLPLNLKAGYTFNRAVRLTAHGGATISYMNNASTVTTTTATPLTTTTTTSTFRNENWDVAPNFGLDVEFGLGDDVLLLIRPDWVLRGEGNIFTGTLGLGFPMG